MKRKYLIGVIAVAAGILALTACSSDKDTSNGAGTAGQSVQGTTGGTDLGSGQTAGDTQGENSGSTASDENAADDPGPAEEDVVLDEEEAPGEIADEASGDIWSGTYTAGEETVSVQLIDENSFSFSFAQSGISGTAEVSGTQAVYKGDDYHVVVFNMADGVLQVSVSSEEDFDAADSPLNGTYIPAH